MHVSLRDVSRCYEWYRLTMLHARSRAAMIVKMLAVISTFNAR